MLLSVENNELKHQRGFSYSTNAIVISRLVNTKVLITTSKHLIKELKVLTNFEISALSIFNAKVIMQLIYVN